MHFLCLCRIFSWVLIKVRTLLMFIFTVSYFFLSLRHTYNCVPSPHYKTPDSQIIQQQDQAATESHVKNTLTGLLFQALEKTKNIETKPPFQLIKNNNNMSCLLNKLQGKTISQKFESFVFFLYMLVRKLLTLTVAVGKAQSPGSAMSEKVRTRLEELDDLEEVCVSLCNFTQ